MTARAEMVLSVLACVIEPGSLQIDRSSCVHVCEVVAHAGECAERLQEIRLVLPANMRLASFPECFRPAKGCAAR
jgi:hypothetical protein